MEDEVFLITCDAGTPPPSTKLHSGISALLTEFKSTVFLDDLPAGVPKTRGEDFKVELVPGAKPAVRPMPRFSPEEQDMIAAEIKNLLEKGFITPSSSPFGAQILFVKKKDGTSRMCLDFRALNEATVKDAYPLPLIDVLFDQLAGKRVFSSLDLRSGYLQMKVDEDSVQKLSFRSPFGSYAYKVVPFGACNAPSAFSRMLDHVFPPLSFSGFMVKYIDDILVFSDSMEDHLTHLRTVFSRLADAQLYPKMSKCIFGAHEIPFLGHVVGRDGIKPDPHKIHAVEKTPAPTSLPELRSFLGMLNYFQRFVPHFADRSLPLTDLTKGDAEWTWMETHQRAFEDLKSALTSSPVLRVFDRNLPVVLQTDASNRAVGAVLLQNWGKGLQPVCYTAKKLSSAEENYPAQQKEMYAIVHALRVWRHYLGRPFKVETDHQSLQQVFKSPDPTRRLSRWYDELAEFNFEIVYRPGKQNGVADFLSRHAATVPAQTPFLSAITVGSAEFLTQVREGYAKDSYFRPVHAHLIEEAPLDSRFKSRVAKYTATDGLLYFAKKEVLCIPNDKPLRTTILQEIHDSAGHFGVEKCYEALERRFFWPHMGVTLKAFIQSCPVCQRHKGAARNGNGLTMFLDAPERAWSDVSMDFISGLPKTARGHDAILTVVDRLTKYTHIIPTTVSATAQDVASLFFANVYAYHGLPRTIVSDRDKLFTSGFWTTLFELIGTRLAMSTVNHAKTDGQTEAHNKVIGQLLRLHAADDQANWDSYLPYLQFAMNNSVSSSTGTTPFYANHGQHPWLPADLASGMIVSVDVPDVNTIVERIAAITKMVKDNITVAQDRQAVAANKGRREEKFEIGDLVMVSNELNPPDKNTPGKFQPGFQGPFKIVKKINDNAYEVDLKDTRRHRVINVEFLKRYITSGPEFATRAPAPAPADDRGHVEIERILGRRVRYGKREYKVRWKGHLTDNVEWLKLEDLSEARDLVNEYDDCFTIATRSSGGEIV